ncbi:MAG: hypothetical protein QXO69_00640 [archaeon]
MKGLFTLDAIIAILLLVFVLLWGQSLASSNFEKANSFGINYEAKAEAVRVSSLANTFLSTKPGANDYVFIAPSLTATKPKAFNDPSANFTITKTQPSDVTVMLQSRFGTATANSPANQNTSIQDMKIIYSA